MAHSYETPEPRAQKYCQAERTCFIHARPEKTLYDSSSRNIGDYSPTATRLPGRYDGNKKEKGNGKIGETSDNYRTKGSRNALRSGVSRERTPKLASAVKRG